MADDAYNILFLCTRNSARSVMAEAIVNRNGHGRFHALSAGTQPAGEVRPEVVRLLRKMNCNPESAYPKSLKDLIRAQMPEPDFLITFCDQNVEKTCPVWPGHPMTALWPMADPGAPDSGAPARDLAYADLFRSLTRRLDAFMAQPKDHLDRMSLRSSLGSIVMMH
ncbi:arsenate reductase ArsC [Roseibium sp. M-1]